MGKTHHTPFSDISSDLNISFQLSSFNPREKPMVEKKQKQKTKDYEVKWPFQRHAINRKQC